MSESHKIVSKKAGLPPGTLMHIGRQKTEKVRISAIDYNPEFYEESLCTNAEECARFKHPGTVSWINIDGLHDVETIAGIGKLFNLHPLLMEDVLNTRHRPSAEEFGNCLLVTIKMLGINKHRNSVISEQISIVLGKDWVITFQEMEGDVFDSLRERLKTGQGNLRHRGADYLLYRLLDVVVDHYFLVTEFIGDATEKLEEEVLESSDKSTLHEIQRLKKHLINLRKTVNPLREAVSVLEKDSNELIEEDTNRYLRDVYEHIIQVADFIETQRDLLASIMDLYLSSVSNKMNQVMKVLTIIATIFIPLTFIAGIYGMNFDNMPELHWQYGYHAVWAVMGMLFIVMLLFFKKKDWL